MLIPGTSITVASIEAADMEGAGDWHAHGADIAGNAWAVRNGQLIASTGEQVSPGEALTWSQDIDGAHGAGSDHVVFGRVNEGAPDADELIVFNGSRILLREGDAVDLDGQRCV